MEISIVEGLRTLKLDLVFTLALAAIFLFAGYGLQRSLRLFARSSIPAPAVGGLLFALLVLALRGRGTLAVVIDTSLRGPLQTAFFTTIGLGATASLLRAGGWRMAFFWIIASLTAVVQNVIGIGIARLLGAPAPLGIICGSLTLTGGPATGLAFADVFEGLGIDGAGALIIASATFGIFISSLIGNPVAAALINRFRLALPRVGGGDGITEDRRGAAGGRGATDVTSMMRDAAPALKHSPVRVSEKSGVREMREIEDEPLAGGVLLHNLLLLLAIMGAGALIGLWLTKTGVTLPAYVGAMVVAAIVRNMDNRFHFCGIDARAVEVLGRIALALFLMIALMDLKLWQLAGLALPMLAILIAQSLLIVVYAVLVTFVLMGRDYEAAVTASGHIGFGLGITPNAVANMEALTARYAPAPRSFLIVPVVGAFFIDFSNSIIITFFVNIMR